MTFKHDVIIADDNGDVGDIKAARRKQKITGWTITEKIGIGIINPRGISKLTIKKEDV